MSSPARLPLTGLPVAQTGRRSATLAAWVTAWLQGLAAADDVVDAVTGVDDAHEIAGLAAGELLTDLLIDLRRRGAGGLRLVLPVPGDPRGLPGPGALTDAALAAGEAVLVAAPERPSAADHPGTPGAKADDHPGTPGAPAGFGLVPNVARFGNDLDGWTERVCWRSYPAPLAGSPPPGSRRQAEQDLAAALREAASVLARLEVARLTPAAAQALSGLRASSRAGRPPVRLPRSHPAQAQALLAQADRLAEVLDIAALDDGAAVDVGTARARRQTLREVGAAVRAARVAAVNAPLDVRD